jgi:hypothetical protein
MEKKPSNQDNKFEFQATGANDERKLKAKENYLSGLAALTAQ